MSERSRAVHREVSIDADDIAFRMVITWAQAPPVLIITTAHSGLILFCYGVLRTRATIASAGACFVWVCFVVCTWIRGIERYGVRTSRDKGESPLQLWLGVVRVLLLDRLAVVCKIALLVMFVSVINRLTLCCLIVPDGHCWVYIYSVRMPQEAHINEQTTMIIEIFILYTIVHYH